MYIFPHFPLHFNHVALFGILLLLGLLGGEIARLTQFLPRITGYIAVGFIVGPHGFNIVTLTLLSDAQIFVDVAVGLILFDLGRHLDFKWLHHAPGMLFMSFMESGLTFIFVFLILIIFHVPYLLSAIGATIAIATSPAIIMMVAHDISAKGPVTRRTFILTSLNNLIALILFTILLAFTQNKMSSYLIIIEHIIYRLLGSLILGFILFYVTLGLSYLTGKNKNNQFILFIGAITLGIGLASSLKVSSMLTLFVFGVAARNFDVHHKLLEVDFGWVARLFFVLLFVITGIYLQVQGLWQVTAMVIGFFIARVLAKTIVIYLFAKKCRLTSSQTFALVMTLCPMAEVAIGMSNRLAEFNLDYSNQLILIITAIVAALNIFGPIITQITLIKMGEAISK
jgi:Kef-type K+ transport system membrane component KefB